MRKTEEAQELFRLAFEHMKRKQALNPGGDPEINYNLHIAMGLEKLASAIRDVYDKLEAIDNKLSQRR